MNRVILIGRLTDDPKSTEKDGVISHARYTMAVDRFGEGTDFISCVTFNKGAEFAAKYLRKGVKVAIEGRIQTGSYTNKDGQKVYTTDVIVERHEFCEKKETNNAPVEDPVSIPEGLDEMLPFK